jgi:hypothetical protein
VYVYLPGQSDYRDEGAFATREFAESSVRYWNNLGYPAKVEEDGSLDTSNPAPPSDPPDPPDPCDCPVAPPPSMLPPSQCQLVPTDGDDGGCGCGYYWDERRAGALYDYGARGYVVGRVLWLRQGGGWAMLFTPQQTGSCLSLMPAPA